ncbi:VOC family protein [Streptomyces cinereospinus]|uniref:VOC family protein n=1 Tax=Streptomyces cinereospinus TaxID=285561 RepID=A0ABV5N7K3_9ACTN
MSTRPSPQLHAYISYRDARAALAWLTAVGFTVLTRRDGPGHTVAHAEARLGQAVLMVADADAGYTVAPLRERSTGGGLYLWLPATTDVDQWYARAVGAGAREVIPPEDTPWGGHRARVLDPQGHGWSAGTYRPGQPG